MKVCFLHLLRLKNYFLFEDYGLNFWLNLVRPDPSPGPGYPGPKSDPDPWARPESKTSPITAIFGNFDIFFSRFLGQFLAIIEAEYFCKYYYNSHKGLPLSIVHQVRKLDTLLESPKVDFT